MADEKWFFPTVEGKINYGMAAYGSESFKDNPMRSLAREICQNSLDNRLNDKDPVEVVFEIVDINVDDIPGMDRLKEVFDLAYDSAVVQNSEEGQDFFKAAKEEAKKSQFKCLVIRDFKTTGLTGSDKSDGTPFNGLVYNVGASNKSGDAGGSKGLGKMAAFIASSFSTVFYSTYADDGLQAAIGVSRLATFTQEDGKSALGTGYYGINGDPMPRQLLPASCKERTREETGTDVIIPGFVGDKKWKRTMLFSVIDGFFYAINRGNLVVKIDDIIINKKTLPDLMKTYSKKFPESADLYYRVLIEESEAAKDFKMDVPGYGTFHLKLMIDPVFQRLRKVACIRSTGMKIQKIDGISSTTPFAGILYVDGKELNILMRSSENPEHTKWLASRPKTKEDKELVEKILSDLFTFISDSLNAMRMIESSQATDLSLGMYLSEAEGQEGEKQEVISDKVTAVTLSRVRVADAPAESKEESEEEALVAVDDPNGNFRETTITGGGGGENQGGGGDQPGHGGAGEGGIPAYEEVEAGKGDKNLVKIPASRTRLICKDKKKGVYRLVYVPKLSATGVSLSLFLSAEAENYDAQIVSAKSDKFPHMTFKDNKIENISFTAGEPFVVEVGIDQSDYCSLEVKASGYTS